MSTPPSQLLSITLCMAIACQTKRGRGGGRNHSMHCRSPGDHRPSHPYNGWAGPVRLSSARQTLLAPSAKRHEATSRMKGELHATDGGGSTPGEFNYQNANISSMYGMLTMQSAIDQSDWETLPPFN